VDGGSRDGTLDVLNAWSAGRASATVLSAPGANIATGRNTAIAHTTAGIIAVSDAGCVLGPDWLGRLAAPLGDVDVAMGYYVPLCVTWFERMSTCLTVPDATEIVPGSFMPSSRSVAFRRTVWEDVNGYPEWLDVGEDMFFNFAVVRAG